MNDEKNEEVKQNEVVKPKDVKGKKKKDGEINSNMDSKKKKAITFGVVGGIVLIIIILAVTIFLICAKPSKKTAEKIVKSYLGAIEDYDGARWLSLIDSKGYIIYQKEGESKFNEKYKDKEDYINKYLDDNFYDDMDDAEDEISSDFVRSYKYDLRDYEFKEISYIKKSKKSDKLFQIKAKVKVKSSYSTDIKNLILYTIKVDGKYKIVDAEFV